ncbi:hypothetical protein MB901379_00979 [Mycobacterium basiliense]|uniref:DUF4436 domain-containing protein n=1 Tax=Mycobacterium basiliense TaxID=2094119 RepID=A0A3S4FNZ0_9MYCO|nr:DUF4436 domain-containing protein [Mycobacterium basiliense]VDM87437.1 hypothetical protein MB901379_00979 [Mycobacterium basiliense]
MPKPVVKVGIAVFIVFFAVAYVASVVLYAHSGAAHSQSEGPTEGDTTTVTMNVEEIQTNYTVLVANLTVIPATALLDPRDHHLNEDVTLRVRSVATPIRRTWTKGMLPGTFPVPLTLAGQINRWPFDHYRSGPIEVELFHGAETAPERVPVTFVNHLSGWDVDVSGSNGHGGYRVKLERSSSSAAFGIVILGVLVAIAALGVFVAVQTVRDRRKFQPPMTTWYAAMLFAVVPLRNALPGAPPFGGWIDITIVVWVIVVLVISMMLYISCWWRHLSPEG